MELLQIVYFCDAAQTENFSKTAQKYRVPASNISQSVNRLEKELNTKLFDRSSNKIALNENGRNFYIRAKAALDLFDDAKTVIRDNGAEVSGDIRLCICTNRRLVTQVIENFRKSYPGVSFNIIHDISLAYDDFDLIIADESFDNGNMEKFLLVREDIVLAMSRENPLSFKKRITSADLSTQRFITMPDNSSLCRYTNKICATRNIIPDIAIQSDDPFYLRKYVELGLGIAFVPSVSWQGLFSENIVFKNVGNFKRCTYVYRNQKRYLSRPVKRFLRELFHTEK